MSSPQYKQAVKDEFMKGLNGDLLIGSRALAFSASAASLAIIMLIAQLSPLNQKLQWALYLSTLAFPIWLSLGLSYDLWIALNLNIKQLHTLNWLPKLQAACFYLTGLVSLLSIGLLVHAISNNSIYFFTVACFIGIALVAHAFIMAAIVTAQRIQDSPRDKSSTGQTIEN